MAIHRERLKSIYLLLSEFKRFALEDQEARIMLQDNNAYVCPLKLGVTMTPTIARGAALLPKGSII